MAFGYARSTGRPGVYAVVPGPGVLNTAAALCTAYGCCAPVLCITGQVPSAFLGRGRGHLHELPDQLGTLRTLTKWAARIERPADAPEIVNEAFRQMLSGRPGPVAIEMAWDTMASSAFVEPLGPAAMPKPAAPSPLEVEAAAKLLAAAKRPMIMTGSGAQHASEAVRALAEELDAPVAAFRGGRGIVPEDHALGISSYAAYRLWPEIDALVGIGTRAEMPYMRWTGMMSLIERPQAPPHLIRIDIDPAEMRRLVPHAGIVADADAGTRALLAAVRRLRGRKGPAKSAGAKGPSEARSRIAAVKAEARAAIEKVQPQLAYLDVIREVLPRDAHLRHRAEPGRVHVLLRLSGLPAAHLRDAKATRARSASASPPRSASRWRIPTRPVVSVTGDGGFLFGVQELATAAQYDIALVTLVFNNASYGNVLRDQRTAFGNRVIGAALDNPDFMLLAKSFGIEGHRVASPAALKPVLQKAIKSKRPVLIEIEVPQGDEVSPWEFIHPKVHPNRL